MRKHYFRIWSNLAALRRSFFAIRLSLLGVALATVEVPASENDSISVSRADFFWQVLLEPYQFGAGYY